MSEADEPTRDLSEVGEHESQDRDHYLVHPIEWLAGASDRGRRHPTNQDFLSVAGRNTPAGPEAVLVISDGVSSSLGAEQAATIAAEVTASTLVDVLTTTSTPDLDEVFSSAFRTANDAVTHPDSPTTGSCTLIAAVVGPTGVTVANIGDSRCYWLPDRLAQGADPVVLSTDDSVAQVRIELGMSREEAERGFQAHAITRWIGPETPDVTPRTTRLVPDGPGWLMLCSDGLWNYASEPAAMAELVQGLEGSGPSELAQQLVAWANEQGGRDNITVALMRLDAAAQREDGHA